MVLGFRLVRWVVWAIIFCLYGWISSFISKFGADFPDFECIWVCKIWLGAPIALTFLKCEHSFFFFSLAGWWNHLMVCWLSFIFLVFYLRNFLYKGMLLPSSLRHMLNLQLSSLAFKIFLLLISLYLFASFLVIFFFLMCYETFSLTKFCCCLFLFCNIVSLIFGFWHRTLHWCLWCIDAIPGTCLWSYTGFCLEN